jgi:mycothiol synthase
MSSPLAPGYTDRAPTPDDLNAVHAMLEATTLAESGEPDYPEEDLRDDWAELDLASDARVVLCPQGEVVGYGSVSHRGEHVRIDGDGYVHPDHVGRGIGTFLVRWMEARAREHVPLAPADARVVLNIGVYGRNAAARQLLEGEGYAPVRHFWRMVIDLDVTPQAPVWPEGITVRACASAEDERLVFATLDEAFRDHWGYTPATYEEWERRAKDTGFDPSLWFLAVDGEEVAGALIGRYYQGMGWVKTLGVRRPWRRRGLGQALLQLAFGEFYRRGRRIVGLGVDAANETGATRLYEGAGMRVAHEYAVYQKELRPGHDPGTHARLF